MAVYREIDDRADDPNALGTFNGDLRQCLGSSTDDLGHPSLQKGNDELPTGQRERAMSSLATRGMNVAGCHRSVVGRCDRVVGPGMPPFNSRLGAC